MKVIKFPKKEKNNYYLELFTEFTEQVDCDDCPLKDLCWNFLENDICKYFEDYIEKE